MKKLLMITAVITGAWLNISAMTPKPQLPVDVILFPGVTKINDNLYTGKVNDNFYLAMERITPANLTDWLTFAKNQNDMAEMVRGTTYLPTTDGLNNFFGVLNQYANGTLNPRHELWVAYASTVPVTASTTEINPSTIDMVMTVITTAPAIIVSHTGISRTWQAAQGLERGTRHKQPGQSIHLHSFAAKVIKSRTPEKVYLLIRPVTAMLDILIKAMPPNSIFIGDNQYLQKLRTDDRRSHQNPRLLLPIEELKYQPGETSDLYAERIRQATVIRLDTHQQNLLRLSIYPPRIRIRTRDTDKEYSILAPNGKLLVRFDEYSPEYQWVFTHYYNNTTNGTPVLIALDALAHATPLDTTYTPA